MSIFIVDLHQAIGKGMTVRPIQGMVNHETNEVFFDNLEIPAENLVGTEGQGFKYILDGLNAERTLIAAECIGDAYWFVERARRYASNAWSSAGRSARTRACSSRSPSLHRGGAANLMRFKACALFDAGKPCGGEANMAKYLAAKASWEAANTCLQTHGGFGFAHEYDVERKFRETRLFQVAPISTNLIYSYVAEHLLGLPRFLLEPIDGRAPPAQRLDGSMGSRSCRWSTRSRHRSARQLADLGARVIKVERPAAATLPAPTTREPRASPRTSSG